MGEPERGKTMYENILSSYPKRTDLWSVYIDMTIKMADLSDVRYDYVLTPFFFNVETRKHSSRMRTDRRSSLHSWGRIPYHTIPNPPGYPTPSPPTPKGHGIRDTLSSPGKDLVAGIPYPPPVDSQTPVKTLPSRNFVGGW